MTASGYQRSIQFPGGSPWGAIGQVEAQRLSKSHLVRPLHLRLFLTALAHANRVGHAEFAPGGLCHELSTIDENTGELSTPRKESVCRAIKQAREMGLLHHNPGLRCLVLSAALWQKEGKGTASCGWHGVGKPGDSPTVNESAAS